MPEVIGSLLNGRYRLDSELGQGGMGTVYCAHDTLLKRDVAVKVLSKAGLGTQGRARLLREAQAVAQLNHPNVVSVHDAGEAEVPGSKGTVPFIVMELVEGDSLHDCPPRSLAEVLDIACQVCAALEHAHAEGIIHRDLKPENILLPPDGSAKLVDFGLARTTASRLTGEGAMLGTVFYIAPEQALGREIDGRADLYTLGVMLYEWTTGRLPFEGDDPLALIGQHLHAPVVPPREHSPEIPPALDALIVQLMSKRPEDRPTSAAKVRQVLEALAREPEAEGTPPDRPREPGFLTGAEERKVEQPVFVARERELARLDGFLEEALAGRGRVVFVTGGPGRGKTALLTEFARRAMDEHPGLLVASGNCNAYSGVGDPYLPFREVMDMLGGDVETLWAAGTITSGHAQRLWNALPQAVQALLAHGPHVVGTLVHDKALLSRAELWRAAADPDLQSRSWLQDLRKRVELQTETSQGPEQSHLFQQVVNVLRAVAEAHPLLLILDDLQWADSASIGLLFHLGRRLEGTRIVVAGTYRPEEVALGRRGERHPLEKALNELKRVLGDTWLELSSVGESEGRRFVDALLETEPNQLGEGFRQALFAHTAGHPLFAIELLRAMQERGDLVQDGSGRWVEGPTLDWGTLPARVEAVIEERLGRLDEELRETLEIASVEGEEFTVQVVARVQEVRELHLERLLSQELEKRHRLVREQKRLTVGNRRLSRYRFAHALHQQYLYHGLSEGARELLHREIGSALADLHTGHEREIAAKLVVHFSGDPERERHYARLAAEQAQAQYANRQAIDYYTQALNLTPETDAEARFELLLARERIYDLQGDREAQEADITSLEALAEQLETAEARARVGLRQARLEMRTDRFQDCVAAARGAVAWAKEAGNRELECLGRLAWGRALGRQGDYPGARHRMGQALELARAAGLPKRVADSLHTLGMIAVDSGDYSSAKDYSAQARAIYHELGDRRGEGMTLSSLGIIAVNSQDYAEAQLYSELALTIAREVGDRLGEATLLGNLGFEAFSQGNLHGASSLHEQALASYREVGSLQGEGVTLCNMGLVALAQGDYAGAVASCEQGLAIAREIGQRWLEGYLLTWLGDALTRLGRLDDAVEHLQQALRLRLELEQDQLVIETRACLARAALARGELVKAQREVDQILMHLDSGKGLEGTDAPFLIHLTCISVLQTAKDTRAGEVLERAHRLLQEAATTLPDDGTRRSFLEKIPWHRAIEIAWIERGGEC